MSDKSEEVYSAKKLFLKHNNEQNNPCIKEQKMSYKCLDDNDYDYNKCKKYFLNYNNCKNFWNEIYKDRRNKGISPTMPDVEEREKIQAELKKKLSNT